MDILVLLRSRTAGRMTITLSSPSRTDIYIGVDGVPSYKLWYNAPDEKFPVKNEGWNLYEARWHKHRQGRKVRNRRPRWALVGVFDELYEAFIAALQLASAKEK